MRSFNRRESQISKREAALKNNLKKRKKFKERHKKKS